MKDLGTKVLGKMLICKERFFFKGKLDLRRPKSSKGYMSAQGLSWKIIRVRTFCSWQISSILRARGRDRVPINIFVFVFALCENPFSFPLFFLPSFCPFSLLSTLSFFLVISSPNPGARCDRYIYSKGCKVYLKMKNVVFDSGLSFRWKPEGTMSPYAVLVTSNLSQGQQFVVMYGLPPVTKSLLFLLHCDSLGTHQHPIATTCVSRLM